MDDSYAKMDTGKPVEARIRSNPTTTKNIAFKQTNRNQRRPAASYHHQIKSSAGTVSGQTAMQRRPKCSQVRVLLKALEDVMFSNS